MSKQMLERITGFSPTATLVIGSGLTREDWKTLCFQQAKGLLPTAILKPRQLAQLIVPESNGRLLDSVARVELLRQSLRDPNLKQALAQLREHRFRPRFFETLDRNLQLGRMRFAHHDEAQVFQSVLDEKVGRNSKREEYFLLNLFWDRLLEVRELWDEPRLYAEATRKLLAGWNPPRALETIYYLQHFPDPPRLQSFWNAVQNRTTLEIKPATTDPGQPLLLSRKMAHSLEDAALYLLDQIQDEKDLDHWAIVIEDQPVIRRTLRRLAQQRGIPLQDERDPMSVVVNEELKVAFLEFELVARGFPLELTLEWVRMTRYPIANRDEVRKNLLERGVKSAEKSSPDFAKAIEHVRSRFPARMKLDEIHSELLKTAVISGLEASVTVTLNRLFQEWMGALESIQAGRRRLPIRHWLDQIQERMLKAPPQVEPHRHRRGLRLYRVDQAASPVLDPATTKIAFFGISSTFFEPILRGEEWFTPQDLETLAAEFQIPSRRELQDQNLKSFRSWMMGRPAVSFEWQYSDSGAEVEPIDMGLSLVPNLIGSEPERLGAHALNLKSLQSTRLKSTDRVHAKLPKDEWSISFVNAYGNCPFTAYAGFLLELRDEEDPDFDLRPTDLGKLVHDSLEILIRAQMKNESLSPTQAFDEAWAARRLVGWLKSDRMYQSIRANVIQLLEEFLEADAEYQGQSGARPKAVEYDFTMDVDGLKLKGRADRIDQHQDGLFLIDYKTSSTVVSGQKALELGKGLQLPTYALGLRKHFSQEVVGATYFQLASRSVSRTTGIYFQKWNQGRKTDQVDQPISKLKSNSPSLFQEEPEVLWARFSQKVTERVASLKSGQFSPIPADPKDCGACRFRNPCGVARRANLDADWGDESADS